MAAAPLPCRTSSSNQYAHRPPLSTFKAFQLPPQPGSFDDCEIGVHAFGFAAFSADVKQVAVSDGQQLEIVDAKTGASTAGMQSCSPTNPTKRGKHSRPLQPSGGL